MAQNKADKHIYDCNSFMERTAGEGSEWDTIVDITDHCIAKKKAQYLL